MESVIPLTIGFQNPPFHWQILETSTGNPESEARNPKRGIQNPRLSWISLHGARHRRHLLWKRPEPKHQWWHKHKEPSFLSLSLSYKFQLLSWINFAPNKIEEIEVILVNVVGEKESSLKSFTSGRELRFYKWHIGIKETLSNDDGSENITKKMNLRPFKFYRVYLEPLNSTNVGEFSWWWILKGLYPCSNREGKICDCVLKISLYWDKFHVRSAEFSPLYRRNIAISGFYPIHFTLTFAGT